MEPTHEVLPAKAEPAPDLTAVVTGVLADLAFMVTDEAPSELPAGTVWMQAEVSYQGTVTGTLRCWCTRSFAARLAANVLGIEAEDREAQIKAEDALREFMNVLCGQLVTAWHGSAAVFNLTIPTVRECLAVPSISRVAAHHSCALVAEGEPLLCTYCRDQ